jgi:hypothetical protein
VDGNNNQILVHTHKKFINIETTSTVRDTIMYLVELQFLLIKYLYKTLERYIKLVTSTVLKVC